MFLALLEMTKKGITTQSPVGGELHICNRRRKRGTENGGRSCCPLKWLV